MPKVRHNCCNPPPKERAAAAGVPETLLCVAIAGSDMMHLKAEDALCVNI